MVSRIPNDAFGEGSSGLDGAWLPKTETAKEPQKRKVSEIREKTRKRIFPPAEDYLGTYAIITIAGVLWGVSKGCEYVDNKITENTITSACTLDPVLGTTHEYKTKRPDGENFPHAILKSAAAKEPPFIVFGDLQKPMHVFQDINSNEIVDGKEELQTFSTPEQAKQFLTEQVRKINAQNN